MTPPAHPSATIVLAMLLCAAPGATAAAADVYRATSDRVFDDVAEWTRVFDDPKRDEWQKPTEVVAALGLGAGMVVADVGAGTGYFSRHLSTAVGPTGTVFAVDVEPNLVAHLRERAEKEGTTNVTPVLASADDPRLPYRGTDLVLFVDTFHHVDRRLDYLRRLKRALRPGGRVAVVDWKKEELPVGPEPSHKIAREQVIDEMKAAGYRLAGEPLALPYQYVLVFAPAE